MLAAIVGGRLQGVELACLARQAGWQTLVVDKNRQVPAQYLCDRFLQVDVGDASALDRALMAVDLVIPALENQVALGRLVQWGAERGVPVAFDPQAHALTRSKIASNRLIASLGISAPEPWPRCGFPIVAKPSGASGSEGVVILENEGDVGQVFPNGFPNDGWVFEQYLDGPSFSLEVIGRPGDYQPLQVTELFMDDGYDCKAVAAPCRLSNRQVREIETLGVTLAEAIELKGLMDVEVIFHNGCFKVLEIDARFPSQTPMAVFHSTGGNMLEMLADVYLNGGSPRRPPSAPLRGVILEHLRVIDGTIFLEGEHIMAHAGPLHRMPGLCGADEAITNYREGARQWVATLITSGRTRGHAERRREQVRAAFQQRFHIDTIVDRLPEAPT